MLCSFSYNMFSQPTEGNFYVFKSDWTPAKSIDDCTYFMQQITHRTVSGGDRNVYSLKAPIHPM